MLLAVAFDLIVFDFDGTLVDSDDAKAAVLKKFALRWSPSMVFPIESSVAASMTRFELVRSVCASLRETKQNTHVTEDLLLKAISSEIESTVASCEQFKNAGNLLSRLRGSAPVYLVSKTPESELIRHVNKFGWDEFFENIYGGPISKVVHLNELRKGLLPSSKSLHIGNTVEDLKASVDSGYWHVNVVNGHKFIESDYEYFLANISNLPELEKFLFSRYQKI